MGVQQLIVIEFYLRDQYHSPYIVLVEYNSGRATNNMPIVHVVQFGFKQDASPKDVDEVSACTDVQDIYSANNALDCP